MASPTRTDDGPLAAVLLGVSLGLLVGGGLAELLGSSAVASTLWALATVAGLGPAVRWVWSSARERRLGVDIIAVLALIGTLAVDEYLAGAVISVMLATGRTLEARATARARSDLRALRERAPRLVHRVEGATLTSPPARGGRRRRPAAGAARRDRPCRRAARARGRVLDESALTGESLLVERRGGDDVRSGAVNAGDAFTLRATSGAAESTYAGIVQLVAEAEAEASTAPFVRLADRYAAAFVAVSLLAAGVAWALSGD